MESIVKTPRFALLATVVSTAVLFSACGGGNTDDAADTAKATASETAMEVTPTSTDGTWTKKAGEWGSFTLAASTYVRYGAGTRWVGKWVTGTVYCNNDFFGGDPAYGSVKECDVFKASTTTTPTPTPSGSAILSWTAPSGSVSGYRVYYGTASGKYSQVLGSGISVGAGSTGYTVSNLAAGSTYYFAVTSVDSTGKESAFSSEASKQIQ